MKPRELLIVSVVVVAMTLLAAKFAPRSVGQLFTGVADRVGNHRGSRANKEDAAIRVTGLGASSTAVEVESSLAVVFSNIEHGDSWASALSKVPLEEVKSNIELASTVGMAAATCSEDPDSNAVTTIEGYDATKAWAVERLAELCENFQAERYRPTVKQVDYARIRLTAGMDAMASEAMRAIRQDKNYFGVVYGLTALVEAGKFPYEILPGGRKNYGPDALMTALSLGAQLQLCAERGGCGPNSMEVAAFCASQGCAEDSTYERALRERMPPIEWKAIQAVRSWLDSIRQ